MLKQLRDLFWQVMILGGWGVLLFAYLSSAVAPGTEVVNFGLLIDKVILALIGVAMVVSGTVMAVRD